MRVNGTPVCMANVAWSWCALTQLLTQCARSQAWVATVRVRVRVRVMVRVRVRVRVRVAD